MQRSSASITFGSDSSCTLPLPYQRLPSHSQDEAKPHRKHPNSEAGLDVQRIPCVGW